MRTSILRVNRKFQLIIAFLTVSLLALYTGCGGDKEKPADFSNVKNSANKNPNGLTDFEIENGIGPVKEKLQLAAIDSRLVKHGEQIFTTKCSACHKLNERYVGPAQGDLIERRSPEYIINMMLNPEEMVKKHPEAQKLLAVYLTQMPNQNLTLDDAKAVLDYFRSIDKKK